MTSVIDEAIELLDYIHRQNQTPVMIHMGERQARAVADELNAYAPTFDQMLVVYCGVDQPPSRRIEWQDVIGGKAYLFDIPIRGVESPDYLKVIGEDRA